MKQNLIKSNKISITFVPTTVCLKEHKNIYHLHGQSNQHIFCFTYLGTTTHIIILFLSMKELYMMLTLQHDNVYLCNSYVVFKKTKNNSRKHNRVQDSPTCSHYDVPYGPNFVYLTLHNISFLFQQSSSHYEVQHMQYQNMYG